MRIMKSGTELRKITFRMFHLSLIVVDLSRKYITPYVYGTKIAIITEL